MSQKEKYTIPLNVLKKLHTKEQKISDELITRKNKTIWSRLSDLFRRQGYTQTINQRLKNLYSEQCPKSTNPDRQIMKIQKIYGFLNIIPPDKEEETRVLGELISVYELKNDAALIMHKEETNHVYGDQSQITVKKWDIVVHISLTSPSHDPIELILTFDRTMESLSHLKTLSGCTEDNVNKIYDAIRSWTPTLRPSRVGSSRMVAVPSETKYTIPTRVYNKLKTPKQKQKISDELKKKTLISGLFRHTQTIDPQLKHVYKQQNPSQQNISANTLRTLMKIQKIYGFVRTIPAHTYNDEQQSIYNYDDHSFIYHLQNNYSLLYKTSKFRRGEILQIILRDTTKSIDKQITLSFQESADSLTNLISLTYTKDDVDKIYSAIQSYTPNTLLQRRSSSVDQYLE